MVKRKKPRKPPRKRRQTRGGKRARAGRKPAIGKEGPPGIPEGLRPAPVSGIDWNAVWKAAWTSATVEEIKKGLHVSEAALAPPGVLDTFRRLVAAGNGAGLLFLKDLIARRSIKTRRADGSSYVIALRARNEADYDQQLSAQETEPDLSTARPRVKALLEKMAEAQSEVQGRRITVLELLAREAGIVGKDGKKITDEPTSDDEPDADPAKAEKKGRSS